MGKASDHAPLGYRFLVQVFGADLMGSETQARLRVARIFGEEKAARALFKRGRYKGRVFVEDGFMVFIPLEKRDAGQ